MRRLVPLSLLLLAIALGGLVWADRQATGAMVEGTRVAGVDVSGLTRDEALHRLRSRIGRDIGRPAQVRVGERSFTLTAQEAGVRVALGDAVDRAYAAGRDGNLASRGFRELTGGSLGHDERAVVEVDREKVRRFVSRIHSRLARRAINAEIEMKVDRVTVRHEQSGFELAGRRKLVDDLVNALSTRSSHRVFYANVVDIRPSVTSADLLRQQPIAVTVSRDDRLARVFDKGELVKTYRVAVGEPKYPTPTGQYTVQSMQKDPVWTVPQSKWAGKLAGKVIPAGDPRNPIIARWIGFNGSVGFHGTKSVGSLGTAASHGCVRMNPDDVSDLFERVRTGTPVLVA